MVLCMYARVFLRMENVKSNACVHTHMYAYIKTHEHSLEQMQTNIHAHMHMHALAQPTSPGNAVETFVKT